MRHPKNKYLLKSSTDAHRPNSNPMTIMINHHNCPKAHHQTSWTPLTQKLPPQTPHSFSQTPQSHFKHTAFSSRHLFIPFPPLTTPTPYPPHLSLNPIFSKTA